MSLRTTPELVAGIIRVNPEILLDPFISTASSLVDRIAAKGLLSVEQLTNIETWLAAHFYSVRDPRRTSETAGSVSGSYEGQTGMALDWSRYGQMAQLLDTTGTLRGLSKGVTTKASVTWLGSEESCCVQE